MKYQITIRLYGGTQLTDTVEASEIPQPESEWKTPIQLLVERLTREGYHRAADRYRGRSPVYYPPHSIHSISYREAK